jgi:hypothetical protein
VPEDDGNEEKVVEIKLNTKLQDKYTTVVGNITFIS